MGKISAFQWWADNLLAHFTVIPCEKKKSEMRKTGNRCSACTYPVLYYVIIGCYWWCLNYCIISITFISISVVLSQLKSVLENRAVTTTTSGQKWTLLLYSVRMISFALVISTALFICVVYWSLFYSHVYFFYQSVFLLWPGKIGALFHQNDFS